MKTLKLSLFIMSVVIVIMFMCSCQPNENNYGEQFTDADVSTLTKDDFAIRYGNTYIDYETNLNDLFEKEGYGNYEDYKYNNFGYISGSPQARRFVIKYPDYSNTKISLICIENLENDDLFIESIILNDVITNRDIGVGSSKSQVIDAYGDEYEIENNEVSYRMKYFDSFGHSIQFMLYDDSDVVAEVLLSYNPNSNESMSIEEYQNSF